MADNYINYLPFKTIYATNFITRTLFSDSDMTYFILVYLLKPYHFDTVLLLIYVISKLVYPNRTHIIESYSKISIVENSIHPNKVNILYPKQYDYVLYDIIHHDTNTHLEFYNTPPLFFLPTQENP